MSHSLVNKSRGSDLAREQIVLHTGSSCDSLMVSTKTKRTKPTFLIETSLTDRMSLLKSLKGTFQNVQQDIMDGFRALGAQDAATGHSKLLQVDAEAGADLLYRYQKDWSGLQCHTTESAQKAEEVDRRVRELFTEWDRRRLSASRLEQEAAMLPTIAYTLTDMLAIIESLSEDFRAVEEELERLEDVREEEWVRREQQSHHCQLAAYAKTRRAEAEAVRGKLWKRLKAKSKEAESLRHGVLTDMDQLSHTQGTSKGREVVADSSTDVSHHAQRDFLSSDEGDPMELSHNEGIFIEDDYTLDYSVDMHDDHFPEIDEDSPFSHEDPDEISSHGIHEDPDEISSHGIHEDPDEISSHGIHEDSSEVSSHGIHENHESAPKGRTDVCTDDDTGDMTADRHGL
ncbi:uncharacterized protein LOC143300335 [Babylonia areolata]|uniref:uncharacterized protein LOC143300335 n=1 Tax=Babylonia areolata TaxID=304850 RepID=UPI003FD087D6